MWGVRREVEGKVAEHLHKGEQIYYEIFGYDGASEIQSGFTYGCSPGQHKVLLYRVSITTPDGFCIDLDREQVYKRAEQLGLEKSHLFVNMNLDDDEVMSRDQWINNWVILHASGKSTFDAGTMREGIVVWFKDSGGNWTNLKHKSEEFLIRESKLRDEEVGDPEDSL